MMAPSIPQNQTERPNAVQPKAERPKEVQHDESPSGITDHAFEPKGAWYTLCKHCNFAESAHRETTQDKREFLIEYYSDYIPDD